MENFILVTYSARGSINEDNLLRRKYSDNYINIDDINNLIEGYPESLHYKINDKIYSYLYRSKKGLESIYRIFLTYDINKAERVKEYIRICLPINCNYIRKGERALFEINIKGTYNLIKYLNFFIFQLNNFIEGGEVYCIKTFDKERVGKLELRDFIVTDQYFNNINISKGYSYFSIYFPYKRRIKESLIEYLRTKEKKVVYLEDEITKVLFSTNRPDFSNGDISPSIMDLLLPGGIRDVINILTHREVDEEDLIIKEIGEEPYKRLKEYIGEVDKRKDDIYRKPIPYDENQDQEIATQGINLTKLERIYKSPKHLINEAEIMRNNAKDKGNISIDTLDIDDIKEYLRTNKLIVDKKIEYKLLKMGVEYKVYIYELSKYPKEIENYLEGNLLITPYDIYMEEQQNFIMEDEDKLEILERYIMENKD